MIKMFYLDGDILHFHDYEPGYVFDKLFKEIRLPNPTLRGYIADNKITWWDETLNGNKERVIKHLPAIMKYCNLKDDCKINQINNSIITKIITIEEFMAPTVTISKKRYNELLADSKMLRQLEAAGVDNWEGYPGGEDDDSEDI